MKVVLVSIFRRALFLVALLCLGCAAQNNTPEVRQRIERQVRNSAELSPTADIKVSDPKPSEFGSWDQVTVNVTDQGEQKSYTFLVSKDGKTLVHYNKFDISTDPNAKIMSQIDLTGRPLRGNKDAKVTVAVFDDFQCPYCARMYDTLFNDVMKRYGDRVKVVYKDFPLYQIHPWAVRAAENANCLLAQSQDAFWQFSDQVHTNQGPISRDEAAAREADDKQKEKAPRDAATDPKGAKAPTPEQKIRNTGLDKITTDIGTKDKLDIAKLHACMAEHNTDSIRTSLSEGGKLGVQATPTLFINGERLEGAGDASDLEAVLDRALKAQGVEPPAAAPQKSEGQKPDGKTPAAAANPTKQ
jgi:protein-disulfide isomerase